VIEETKMKGTGKNNHENEILILLCLSRGAESRKKILNVLLYKSKNCNQIAQEVELDWWTVQRHLRHLLKENIVENSTFGNSKYYRLTQKGKDATKFISQEDKNENGNQVHTNNNSLERIA
jgi:predicted transcriptional regulator